MNLLNELCNISAVSGSEEHYIEFLKSKVEKYNAYVRTDNMNNLFVCFGEDINSETVIIECGIDEPGIMVCGVEDNGKVNFDAVGAVNAVQFVNAYAMLDGNVIGVIRTDKNMDDNLKISDLYLELNCEKEEAKNKINVGDFCSVKLDLFVEESSKTVISDFLSTKLPSYTVLKLLEKLNAENMLMDKNVCIIFSTQKLLGARGIKAALSGIDGKYIISVGCAKADENFKLNCGCGILAKDSGTVTSLAVRKQMQKVATEKEISYQININEKNQFINSMSVSGNGFLCGGINIPVSRLGAKLEKASLKDIDSAVELLYQNLINY